MKIASITAVAITTSLFAAAAVTPAKAWKDGITDFGTGAVSSIHPEPLMPRVNGTRGGLRTGGIIPLDSSGGLTGFKGSSGAGAVSSFRPQPIPSITGFKGMNSFKGFSGFNGFKGMVR